MDRYFIQTETPLYYLIPGIILAAGYAWLLYSKKPVWSTALNRTLAVIRFIIVLIVYILLLNPALTHVKTIEIPPTILLAIDNSTSIADFSANELESLKDKINKLRDFADEKNMNYRIVTLDKGNVEEVDSIQLNQRSTDLHQLIRKADQYPGLNNVWGTVLFSDGVFNRGMNPSKANTKNKIFTITLGDTTKIKDILIRQLLYNRIAYAGNKFKINAQIKLNGEGFDKIVVRLSEKGKQLQSKEIIVKPNQTFITTEFIVDGAEYGSHDYMISADPFESEKVTTNNRSHAYIEIIENKVRILIAANGPHPDVKAIREALNKFESYEVAVYVPGLNTLNEDEYDLVVFHHIPNVKNGHNELLAKIQSKKIPALFIAGALSNFNQLSGSVDFVSIKPKSVLLDDVTPYLNPQFTLFSIEPEFSDLIKKMPPWKVPFADYQITGNAEAVFLQEIGNVQTQKPLIVLGRSLPRSGLIIGEGFWNLRIQEYALNGTSRLFDGFMESLVKFLSVKDNTTKFKVYPVQKEYDEGETVKLEAEIYDEIFNRSYGQKISLSLKNSEGKSTEYSFINQEREPYILLSGLPPGVYSYAANSEVNNIPEKYSDKFTIRELNLESLNPVADHQLMKEVALNSGGLSYHHSGYDEFIDYLNENTPKKLLKEMEQTEPIVHMHWILILIVALATIEWVSRKMNGDY